MKIHKAIDIYPAMQRQVNLDIFPIAITPIILIPFIKRVRDSNSSIVFFPEAGGIILRENFEKMLKILSKNGLEYHVEIFSSKVTAPSKAKISKQIVNILSGKERSSKLSKKQLDKFKFEFDKLPKEMQMRIKTGFSFGNFKKATIEQIVSCITEVGLYIKDEKIFDFKPSELKLDQTSPTASLREEIAFQEFRTSALNHIAKNDFRIEHKTRELLNIVLSETKFAKSLKNGKIYVIDEAISRGRTLNTLEIIFKSFYKSAKWKIGVLYCPGLSENNKNIDFVFSTEIAPPFSNRPDLVGKIVLETETAFTKYSIKTLSNQNAKEITREEKTRVWKYFKMLEIFIKKNYLLQNHADGNVCFLMEEDIIRLINYFFVEENINKIKSCIDLNPIDCTSIIEETSFYLNMPHPFSSLVFRNAYKNSILEMLQKISSADKNSIFGKQLQLLKEEFIKIRPYYEAMELNSWTLRNNIAVQSMNKTFEDVGKKNNMEGIKKFLIQNNKNEYEKLIGRFLLKNSIPKNF